MTQIACTVAEQRSISIFSVYASQDALFYEQIERHLNAWKRQGLISEREREAGSDVQGEQCASR